MQIQQTSTPEKAEEFRRGWPILATAIVGCAGAITVLPFYSLGLFIAPLQAEFGWGRGEIASSFLYIAVVMALTSPILGYFLDRFGAKPVALVSVPLAAAALFGISKFDGSITGFHALYGLIALFGCGASPITYCRAVNGSFEKARGLALGISLAGTGVASILLPSVLTLVIEHYGWRGGYQFIALMTLVPWVFVLFGLKRPANVPVAGHKATTAGDRMEVLKSGTFWLICLSFTVAAIAVSALVVHMVPLLKDMGLDAQQAAGIASVIGVGVLSGRVITGYFLDRYFASYVAVALFLIAAGGCLLLLVGGVSFALPAGALVGFTLGAEIDLVAYMAAKYFGLQRFGFAYAIAYSTIAIGFATGPALAGDVFDLTGSYTTVFWGIIALLMVSSILVLLLPRYDRREQREVVEGRVEVSR